MVGKRAGTTIKWSKKIKLMNKIKIGLVGHSYSRGNFGLCALAFGEQYVIERVCADLGLNCEIICFETGVNHPCNDNSKVRLEEYNLRNVIKTAKQFSKCDLIFDITGGDSFSDIYGVKLFIVNYFIKMAVMLSGVKYISAPQTYGPFSYKWIRMLSNLYLSKSAGIYGRDEMSGNALTKKNKDRIKSVVDLGFALPFIQQPKFEKSTVGFNVNGLLYNSNKLLGDDNSYNGLCDKIIEKVKSLGVDIVLIPHVIGEDRIADNDYYVSVELARKHGLKKPPFFQSPQEAKGYISRCHFFIGSRMHATIGAVSCGIPTLPLAYSRKFEGVYNSIEYHRTLDLRKNTQDEILSKIEDMLITNFQQATEDVSRSLLLVRQKTDEYIKDIENVVKCL